MRKLLAVMAMITMFCGPVQAEQIDLISSVFIERVEGNGSSALRRLETARSFRSGDRVVTILRWKADGNAKGFAVTSPLPRTLRFADASGDIAISTDGGITYRAPDNYSGRITHLRWQIDPSAAARGHGQVSYSATVR